MLNNYQEEYTPKLDDVFNALYLTAFNDVKVVILGQDPYPGLDVAMGLSFSVNKNVKIPKSLTNMYKELEGDLSIIREDGDLSDWAKQGVLLLNTILTNKVGQTNAHKSINWQMTTDKIITDLSNRGHVVFVLLGKPAQTYNKLINKTDNLVLNHPHPSPLSAYRGFYGSKIYSTINEQLDKWNIEQIKW